MNTRRRLRNHRVSVTQMICIALLDGSSGRVRKYSFPRRRANTTSLPATTLPTVDVPEDTQSDIQLLESKEHQSTDTEVGDEITTKLPDLANSAVVAIHNLAIMPPTTQPIPEAFKRTRKFRHSTLSFDKFVSS
jgi:hypothetical protein